MACQPFVSSHVEGVATVGKVWNVVSPQYALLAKGTFHFTIYNVTFGKSKWLMLKFRSIPDDFDLIVRTDSSTLKLYLVKNTSR